MSFSIIAVAFINKEFKDKSIKDVDSNLDVKDTAKAIKKLVGGSVSTGMV